MEEQMDMRIDKSRHECPVSQIDAFGACRASYFRTDFDNPFAPDKHFSGRDHSACFDIENARRVQHDRGLLRLRDNNRGANQSENKGAHTWAYDSAGTRVLSSERPVFMIRRWTQRRNWLCWPGLLT